jgi:hypothetical protein
VLFLWWVLGGGELEVWFALAWGWWVSRRRSFAIDPPVGNERAWPATASTRHAPWLHVTYGYAISCSAVDLQ